MTIVSVGVTPLWLPGQTQGSAPTSARRSYQPPPFSPGVFTLFTLFTLFFNSAKRQFHCKNWQNQCKSYFVKVRCLPSGFVHKFSTNVLFCEGEKMSYNPLLRGGIEGGGGGRRSRGGGGLLACHENGVYQKTLRSKASHSACACHIVDRYQETFENRGAGQREGSPTLIDVLFFSNVYQ